MSTKDKGAWESLVASLSSSQVRAPYLAANEHQLDQVMINILYVYYINIVQFSFIVFIFHFQKK